MKIRLSEGAAKAIDLLQLNNHKAYAVGGCVRDMLMGRVPEDFDITTDATTDEMLRIFADYKTITLGIKHGTVTVFMDDEAIECTTFRIDGEYKDSRHPESVSFTRCLNDDLLRRDFTINAVSYNEKEGIVDLFGGISDISSGIIKCIGDPEKRFTEDALRILRALRFASVLGFAVEKKTAEAMEACSQLLSNVSAERITDEFRKILIGENVGYVLDNFSNILSLIVPLFRANSVLTERICSAPPDFCYRMALILKEARQDYEGLDSLKLSANEKSDIIQLSKMTAPENKKQLKEMLRYYSQSNVIRFLTAEKNQAALDMYNEIIDKNECYNLSMLNISGNDVISAGIEPKETGKILNQLLTAVINEEIPNIKEELLKAVH